MRTPKRDARFNERAGKLLEEMRVAAGLTQGDLAERTGITKVRICRLETGSVRLLAEEIPLLCAALGVGERRFLRPVAQE